MCSGKALFTKTGRGYICLAGHCLPTPFEDIKKACEATVYGGRVRRHQKGWSQTVGVLINNSKSNERPLERPLGYLT